MLSDKGKQLTGWSITSILHHTDNAIGTVTMYTVITQRFIESAFEESACTVAAATDLAKSKQFYRVQLVDEFDCIVWEVKQDKDPTLTNAAVEVEVKQDEGGILARVEIEGHEFDIMCTYNEKAKAMHYGWKDSKSNRYNEGLSVFGNPYMVDKANRFVTLQICIEDLQDHLSYRLDIRRSLSGKLLGKFL